MVDETETSPEAKIKYSRSNRETSKEAGINCNESNRDQSRV
jgi:hypothetical protein